MILAKPLPKASRKKNGPASAAPRGRTAVTPPAAGSNSQSITSLAERLIALGAAYRADVTTVIDQAKAAEVDAPALRRLAAWMQKDELMRLEQEAVDDQYRFLAGLRATPAELPAEGELATAAALFADNMTIRAVAKEMGLSVGKVHQLKIKAAAFGVHFDVNVNTDPQNKPPPRRATVGRASHPPKDAPAVAAEAAHDPATGEIKEEGSLSGRDAGGVPSGRDAPSDEHSESCGGGENRRPAEAGNMPGSVPGEEMVSAPSRLVGLNEEGSSKARAEVATGPQDTDWDALVASQPAALRRVPA